MELKIVRDGIKKHWKYYKDMAKIKRYTTADGAYHGELGFMCPGCKEIHFITDNLTEEKAICNGPWAFNNDFETPTISPSILVQWTEHRCHSFIKNGMIQFLTDCTHDLKGQTVELPEIKNDYK